MISDAILLKILELQKAAIAAGNPPFAAVITVDDVILSSGANESRTSGDPLKHAEMLAIQTAISKHGAAILSKAHLISSNEPCPMCIGACIWSGIRNVTYFVSQEQVSAIRGWGRFMSAHGIAEADDSGILVTGPIEHEGMRRMHHDFWTADKNSEFKHSIHLSGGKIKNLT